ncbi:hypothetical protein [Streptacidiphilus griseoplanus]|uniref:hypothetical protein n=1 Tax=Peterkaempfera griseoplana TaxID=66896 RepID=UPI000A6EB476|nr:hypothetical protein [Peterkaempfera griseoplana]
MQEQSERNETAPGAARARSRATAPRVLGGLLAMLALLVGFTLAPSSASAAPDRTLTGTWDLTVTVWAPEGPAVTTPTFHFHPDHTLNAEGPPDVDGGPQYAATGFWNTDPDGSFVMYITHGGRADGAIPGMVQAVHMGKIRGHHFTSHADAFVLANPGDTSYIGPVTVTTVGTWVSSAN